IRLGKGACLAATLPIRLMQGFQSGEEVLSLAGIARRYDFDRTEAGIVAQGAADLMARVLAESAGIEGGVAVEIETEGLQRFLDQADLPCRHRKAEIWFPDRTKGEFVPVIGLVGEAMHCVVGNAMCVVPVGEPSVIF